MDALLEGTYPAWKPRMLLMVRRDSRGQNLAVTETPLPPGGWSWNASLWGNLYLPYDGQDGARPGLEHEQTDQVECRELRALGNLARARPSSSR